MCMFAIYSILFTLRVVVVDPTEAPRGCKVLSGDCQVDRVGQIKLYSYTQAALHKHKVSEPVNAHSFKK